MKKVEYRMVGAVHPEDDEERQRRELPVSKRRSGWWDIEPNSESADWQLIDFIPRMNLAYIISCDD